MLACAIGAGAGCASMPAPDVEPVAVELTDVPFFAQTRYQCGPAALATVLSDSGIEITPDRLVDEVYIEALRGSLQAELLGAARRHGRLPVVIEGGPRGLFAEIAAGHPVLILQNLGLPRLPLWHYAVVIGYDGRNVVLRSGTEARRLEPLRRFLGSWERGGKWGFVALAPGALPAAGAPPEPFVRALSAAEPMLGADATALAVDAALERWPQAPVVLFAAAESRQRQGASEAALRLYRRLLRVDPQNAAAHNNLANLLGSRGCRTAALREAHAALASIPTDSPLRPAIRDSVQSIERQATPDEEPAACATSSDML